MSGVAGPDVLKFIQKAWQVMQQGRGYEKMLQQVSITAAGNGGCTAEFKVDEGLTNNFGTLHGGCTATIIDCITTLGLLTTTEKKPGVSVNLSVNYQKSAAVGTLVEVEAKTLKTGKTLAFLEAIVRNKENGKIIATGSHVKFIGD